MITLQPWCGGRLRANRPKRRDQRADERERRERTRGRRAPRGIKNEPRWEQGAHTGGAICAHAWTTPDISWSALPLGIHDNTVSWEVGMTTTGRREKRRRQREEGGERGRRGGEEKKEKENVNREEEDGEDESLMQNGCFAVFVFLCNERCGVMISLLLHWH